MHRLPSALTASSSGTPTSHSPPHATTMCSSRSSGSVSSAAAGSCSSMCSGAMRASPRSCTSMRPTCGFGFRLGLVRANPIPIPNPNPSPSPSPSPNLLLLAFGSALCWVTSLLARRLDCAVRVDRVLAQLLLELCLSFRQGAQNHFPRDHQNLPHGSLPERTLLQQCRQVPRAACNRVHREGWVLISHLGTELLTRQMLIPDREAGVQDISSKEKNRFLTKLRL